MGSGASTAQNVVEVTDNYESRFSNTSIQNGALSDDALGFQILLENPIAYSVLMDYATENIKEQLRFWLGLKGAKLASDFSALFVLLYNVVRSDSNLYHKYESELDDLRIEFQEVLGENMLVEKGVSSTRGNTVSFSSSRNPSFSQGVIDQFEAVMHDRLKDRKLNNGPLQHLSRLHAAFLSSCFQHLCLTLYQPFKEEIVYLRLLKSLAISCPGGGYVGKEDFDFFSLLGTGGFGSIFSCSKRSTGELLAMKIQPKALLMDTHKRSRRDVIIEALASTSCRHPYICEAQYAFQTTKLVFLALPIYACGNLRRAMLMQPEGCFSRDRAQFYIAVVASVLMYLHSHGLIYRDLKPENLLLHSDGHIALCDLGSVSDELGGLADGFGSDIGISVMSGSSGGWQHSASAPALSPSNSFSNIPQQLSYSACMSMSNNEQARIQAPRGKGVFGTLSYMAPEILGQFSSECGEGDRGQDYTSAVDWFSLGVLAHEFLFGIVPFAIPPHINYKVLRKVYPSVLRDHNHDLVASFTSIFGARVAVDGVTDDVEELLNGLLALDKSERLGCSIGSGKEVLTNENDEFAAIKSLSFFGSIDFDLLERKKIPPPFVPSSSDVFQVVTDFPLSCDEALAHYRLATWRDDVVADESSQHYKKHRTLQLSEQAQELFQAWQFVHPKATLKEMVAVVRKKGKM